MYKEESYNNVVNEIKKQFNEISNFDEIDKYKNLLNKLSNNFADILQILKNVDIKNEKEQLLYCLTDRNYHKIKNFIYKFYDDYKKLNESR